MTSKPASVCAGRLGRANGLAASLLAADHAAARLRHHRAFPTAEETSMTPELKMLALSIVLGLVQIVLASHAASLQRGYRWTASARDEAVPALTGIAGRLNRALRNFIETFPLFAAAVLMAHIAGKHNWMTEWGAQLYFGARVAYVAVYAAGIVLLRSLVWNVATLGIILILLSVFWE
jgi:uncharacterized MAPEG superfamily protein